MTPRRSIYEAIDREREWQLEKWSEGEHAVGEWLLIMEAELEEAKAAFVKTSVRSAALRELLQAVAVGVACLEHHGVVERN